MKAHRTLGRCCNLVLIFGLVSGFFCVPQVSRAQAQTRVNDRDMAAMMRNLHQDANSFRPPFDHAVHRSTIRHTSQERDARGLSKTFDKETEKLLHHFKKDRNGEAEFRTVSDTAAQIDHVVDTVELGPKVRTQWQKIRTELHQIAVAYGFPDRFHD
ncbi:MAG TPA: hypothetical protein VND66_07195 [Acidobacteriaceae bacterium]|nr:hypothetical protein [Terriglobia bacterium]HVC90391.1 hypothetical protein [Acidobacteriaceae bacterium]